MYHRFENSPEKPMIEAKREFHLSVARAWYEYDDAVEPFRVIRDAALLEANNQNDPVIWEVYDDATYNIRLRFEKDVASKWRKRKQEIEAYREMKRSDR